MSDNDRSAPDLTDKLTVIRKQNTYEIIIDQLKSLILSGELKPGQKLPGERSLSEKFGASRNSVRLALKLLEFINLLEIRPGSGVYVSSRPLKNQIYDSAQWISVLKQHPLKDLIEARKCFEPYIASLAAKNAEEREIAEMEEDLSSMEAAVYSRKKVINQAARFHELLVGACKNIILVQIGMMLNDLGNESKRVSLIKQEHTKQSLDEHREILAAVKAGDSEAASIAMQKHLASVEKHLSREGI